MDVELQILKHLARDPDSTVSVIDKYCAEYKNFPNSNLLRGFNNLISAINQFQPFYSSG
ncbi:hypothetical protein [Limnofasciculus baicalensis]|uniref:Uncharacterized protein n=1 Tax=Limnofasciculus baicalensis BBK-W-15 TaxID=2699891 RepID=A0AAE3GRM2_9CYAN|nr:hypothetical protein [Limnofasciculus baicalensis]MCP2728588.1 hypothetical protein [Limnofasciculus baicalensis BBK-W-15]